MKLRFECALADGFSFREKLYAQFSFLAMGVTGAVGIALVDWRWVFPYLVIYMYGILGIVMRHLTCPRCPHLYVYGDCLQLSPKMAMWLVKERKTTPFSAIEKSLFYLIFLLVPTFPIYWLVENPILLSAFLVTVAMWYSGQFLYFCRRCRVTECPFNRAA
jgi:hypothetical protein